MTKVIRIVVRYEKILIIQISHIKKISKLFHIVNWVMF